jgi:predicted permease
MWSQIVPGRDLLRSPGTSWLRIIGRLKAGVTVPQAEASLTLRFRRVLEEVFSRSMSDDVRREIDGATLRLTPAGQGVSRLRSRFAQPLELLMAAVVLVLVISCANVANLLLARAASRRREIDLRLALGMSRVRLIRQLLTESLVLATVGGTIGLAMAWFGREALLRLISGDGSRLPVAVHTDLRLLVFVAGVSIATAIIFGSVPAWRSVRAELATSLASRHATAGRRAQILGPGLVVAQVAVSMVLLMGAGLFLRTLANLRNVDLGFVAERLVILNVNPRAAGYGAADAPAVTQRILESLRTVPGVTAASFAENGVMFGRDSSTNVVRPEGYVPGADGLPRVQWDIVGPRYFSTMGVGLLAGRDFSDRDDETSPRVVAITEAMAHRFFAGANPIGRRLVWGDRSQTDFDVIAVVRDVKQSGPRDAPHLRFYIPYRQLSKTRPSWEPASIQFLVRTATTPGTMLQALERSIVDVEPRLSVDVISDGPDLVERALVQERMVAALSVAFGVLGAGLAWLGLYGLIGYQVAQRTSEIGIRMALGAQRGQVMWATLQRALAWTAAGVALGIPLALTASYSAEKLLFGLTPLDMATLVSAAIIMAALGALAACIPARRASRVDPMVALRYE